jgi:hypothetical protein
MKVKRAGVMLVLGLVVLCALSLGKRWRIHSESSSARNEMIAALQNKRNCQGGEVSLAAVVPERYAEICLQPAYLARIDFEHQTGRVAPGYDMLLHDGAVTWWLFDQDGQALRVDMSEAKMVKSPVLKSATCYSREKSTLTFQCRPTMATSTVSPAT